MAKEQTPSQGYGKGKVGVGALRRVKGAGVDVCIGTGGTRKERVVVTTVFSLGVQFLHCFCYLSII